VQGGQKFQVLIVMGAITLSLIFLVGRAGIEPTTNGLKRSHWPIQAG